MTVGAATFTATFVVVEIVPPLEFVGVFVEPVLAWVATATTGSLRERPRRRAKSLS